MGIQRENQPEHRSENGSQLSVDLATARFKQGQCPCCGKGLGDSRGLEYRSKSADLYCHSCKRSWPDQMDLAYLEEQIALILSQQQNGWALANAAERPAESLDLMEILPARERDSAPALARMLSGFGNLLGGVLKRH